MTTILWLAYILTLCLLHCFGLRWATERLADEWLKLIPQHEMT